MLTPLRRLLPGATFWRNGELWRLELLNECRAQIQPVDRKTKRTFTTVAGEVVTIESTPNLNVSPDASYETADQ